MNHSRRDVLAALGGTALGTSLWLPEHLRAQTSPTPWTPAALGERIWLDWRAEDLATGAVSQWRDRMAGVTAVQGETGRQPQKTSYGLEFATGARRLVIPAQTQAHLAHRAILMVFRVDFTTTTSTDGAFAVFNGYDGANTARQPAMLYKNTGSVRTLVPQWRDPRGYWSLSHTVPDGSTLWHAVVTRRVGGNCYSSLDGSPEMMNGGGALCLPKPGSATGLIGDFRDYGPKWVLDCLIVLQDELSDADAQRLIAWGLWRKGAQAQLPATHPYRNAAPALAGAPVDPPYVESTAAQWTSLAQYWDGTNILQELERGFKQTLDLSSYRVVFEDTFDKMSITDEVTGTGPWYCPVHPAATGSARTAKLADTPATFVQANGELVVKMQQGSKGWQSGVFTSVNLNGHGNKWLYGYFEMRGRAKTGNGFGSWPAFWLKTTNEFFRLTETRVEIDAYEGYASDPKGHHQSFHNWPAARLLPGRLTTHRYLSNYTGLTATQWLKDVNLFDNAYHDYGVLVSPEWIIYYFDGYELARFPTPVEAKKPLFLLVDLALLPSEASKVSGVSEWAADRIRVWQTT